MSRSMFEVVAELVVTVPRCPTAPTAPTGETHTIIGCGSTNVSEPDSEGLIDCLDCGVWFDPKLEA